jgi:Fe-S cluster assembly ATP-binding protein
MTKLELKNLSVNINDKQILDNISFELDKAEIIILMGPNGAGKSSISKAIISHPKYQITKGQILLNQEDITNLPTHEKAKKVSSSHIKNLSQLKVSP